MIFDDHEIADDWNLNGRWASRVYNREWGRFVVRNGLLAYALMQGWGNDPAALREEDKPGKKLLDAIPAVVAGADADHRRRHPARLRQADDRAAEADRLQLLDQDRRLQRGRARHAAPTARSTT